MADKSRQSANLVSDTNIFSNPTTDKVGIGTTNATSKLTVAGDVSVSGIITASGGFNIGIQSAGENVTTGIITALNFVGTGNTFVYNSSTKTIDISISGGGGGSALMVIPSRSGTAVTFTIQSNTLTVVGRSGNINISV